MKKIIIAFLTSAAFAAGVCAQQLTPDKVPTSVRSGFHSKFPAIKKVEWKLKTDQNYEAEFKLKGVEVAVKFSPSGDWLEIETTIPRSELTPAVVTAIAR